MAKTLFQEIQEIKNTDTISFIPNLPIVAELQLKGLKDVHHFLKKPFDENLSLILERTAKKIMEQHSPCIIAHSFSNEITLVLHSKDNKSYQKEDFNHHKSNQNSKLFLVTKLTSLATSCFEQEKSIVKESKETTLHPEVLNKFFQFNCNCWNVPKTIKAIEWLMFKENRARHIAAAKICSELKIDIEDQNTKSLIESLAKEGIVLEKTYGEHVYRGYFQKKRKMDDGSRKVEKLKIPPIHMIYNKLGVFFGNEEPMIIEPNKVPKHKNDNRN